MVVVVCRDQHEEIRKKSNSFGNIQKYWIKLKLETPYQMKILVQVELQGRF